MKKLFGITLIGGCLLFVASCGGAVSEHDKMPDSKKIAKEQNENKFDNTSMEKDATFVVKAADGGMMEVNLSKNALDKVVSEKAKALATAMVDDHGKANTELETIAKNKNISIPATLSDKKHEKYDDISSKAGADFEKVYIDCMVNDHEDAINLFKEEAENGNDADLKKWAADKLPVLEHHLEMAKDAKAAFKK